MDAETTQYLEQHKIPTLIEQMTAALIFNRPDNPREFLRQYAAQLKLERAAPSASFPAHGLIQQKNIDAVFLAYDPTRSGSISFAQYQRAMQSLGIAEYNQTPAGYQQNKITLETFSAECSKSLKAIYATYKH